MINDVLCMSLSYDGCYIFVSFLGLVYLFRGVIFNKCNIL